MRLLSSYTSILGDTWLWKGVPRASSALMVHLPEKSHECVVHRRVSLEAKAGAWLWLSGVFPFRTATGWPERRRSQFEYNYFTETCSGSKARSYLRLKDFEFHSTLGLRVIQKKKKKKQKTSRLRRWTAVHSPLFKRRL
jgi:hypothetical protein